MNNSVEIPLQTLNIYIIFFIVTKWNFLVNFHSDKFSIENLKLKHMLIVMDKSTHDESLSQSLQTNIEQISIAITFFSVLKGVLNVTYENKKIFFTTSLKS